MEQGPCGGGGYLAGSNTHTNLREHDLLKRLIVLIKYYFRFLHVICYYNLIYRPSKGVFFTFLPHQGCPQICTGFSHFVPLFCISPFLKNK